MARRIVDLTQPLSRNGADGAFSVLEYERPRSGHGVFHRVDMETTVGTHVVTSRRYLASGYSLAEAPIDRFFGEGIVVRLPSSPGAAEIGPTDLDDAAGDRVRRGDIAVLALAPNSSGRVKLTVFASQWLWDKGIKMLVLDHRIGIGSSPSWNEERTVLTSLFANEIPVVRGATNTDQLSDERFAVMALPMRIEGVEAWPVRVVALDPGEPPTDDPEPAADAPAADPPAAPVDAEASDAGTESAAATAPATETEADDSGNDEAPAQPAVGQTDDAPAEAKQAGGAVADEAAVEDAKPDATEPAEAVPTADAPENVDASEPAIDDAPGTDDSEKMAEGQTDSTAANTVTDAESGSSPRSGS